MITANHAPLSQEYAKKGCPVSLRAELWKQILGIELDEFVSDLILAQKNIALVETVMCYKNIFLCF